MNEFIVFLIFFTLGMITAKIISIFLPDDWAYNAGLAAGKATRSFFINNFGERP